MKKNFLEKSSTKCGGEANLYINSLKYYNVCFYYYVQVEVYQNVLELRCRPLAFSL